MSGVLVVGEIAGGRLRASTLELIGAGLSLCGQGAGSLAVALIGHDLVAHGAAVGLAGVQELLLVPTPQEHPDAHVSQAALEALIEQRRPTVVLAGHTTESLGFAPAVAARMRLGFASDVLSVSIGSGGLLARRPAYAEALLAELDFPSSDTVLLLLRPGCFEPAGGEGSPVVEELDLELGGAQRSERIELLEPPAGDVEIGKADFLLSVGRGIGDREQVLRFAALAERMGATLAASGPPVEAGWMPRTRKVGQSGMTVSPRVYLAFGISGAPQHLAGIAGAGRIIAINSDPDARIFDVAHYGAVADLFEVAAALELELG